MLEILAAFTSVEERLTLVIEHSHFSGEAQAEEGAGCSLSSGVFAALSTDQLIGYRIPKPVL